MDKGENCRNDLLRLLGYSKFFVWMQPPLCDKMDKNELNFLRFHKKTFPTGVGWGAVDFFFLLN